MCYRNLGAILKIVTMKYKNWCNISVFQRESSDWLIASYPKSTEYRYIEAVHDQMI